MNVVFWIDDVREPPNFDNYVWCKSVNAAKTKIIELDQLNMAIHNWGPYIERINIRYIDIDHDAGDYAADGGDYIELLKWFEKTGRRYPIHIHSMNPVGIQNMRRIIKHNNWSEVR